MGETRHRLSVCIADNAETKCNVQKTKYDEKSNVGIRQSFWPLIFYSQWLVSAASLRCVVLVLELQLAH